MTHVRTSRYEYFSSRVPQFPQVVLLAVMLAYIGWLSVMTVPVFLHYQQEALHAVYRGHFAIPGDLFHRMLSHPLLTLEQVFGTGFGMATRDLVFNLTGIVGIAYLLPLLPIFNEVGRPAPGSLIGRFFERAASVMTLIVMVIFTGAFAIWCLAAGIGTLVVSAVPLLVNPWAVITAFLAIALAHAYVAMMIFNLWEVRE